MTPAVLELFAGTGGASLGLHRAGWRHRAAIERAPAAVRTLRASGLPGIEADVYEVDFSRQYCSSAVVGRRCHAVVNFNGAQES